jgi:hypothetical protein
MTTATAPKSAPKTRTAKHISVAAQRKPEIHLVDPSKPAVNPALPTPIVATATVAAPALPEGINSADVSKCNKLVETLITARKKDKATCRELGIIWNKMKAGWKGQGAFAKWVGDMFGFSERTVYLYMKLAEKWDYAADHWTKNLPNLPLDRATVNELMGFYEKKWASTPYKSDLVDSVSKTSAAQPAPATTATSEATTVAATPPTTATKEAKLEYVMNILKGYVTAGIVEIITVKPGEKVKAFTAPDMPVIFWPGVEAPTEAAAE